MGTLDQFASMVQFLCISRAMDANLGCACLFFRWMLCGTSLFFGEVGVTLWLPPDVNCIAPPECVCSCFDMMMRGGFQPEMMMAMDDGMGMAMMDSAPAPAPSGSAIPRNARDKSASESGRKV